MFDELRKAPFRPWKQKQGHAVEVEDGGLLGFAAFKDLQVSFEENAQAEVRLRIQDFWVVPKRATRHANIGDVYGVGFEGEDEDSDDEDLEQPGEVVSSSSSDLRNPPAVPSTSSSPAAQFVFAYDGDEAVLKAMERGNMHDWTKVEFKAICRKHGLVVNGGKGEFTGGQPGPVLVCDPPSPGLERKWCWVSHQQVCLEKTVRRQRRQFFFSYICAYTQNTQNFVENSYLC